jgi:MFS family permease
MAEKPGDICNASACTPFRERPKCSFGPPTDIAPCRKFSASQIGSAGLAALALLPAHPSVPNIVWRMAICGAGFGLFQSPNLKMLMSSPPPRRAGGASGVITIARLTGQTIGAALVAFCCFLAGGHGPVLALALALALVLVLAAPFAAAASAASFARRFAAGTDANRHQSEAKLSTDRRI